MSRLSVCHSLSLSRSLSRSGTGIPGSGRDCVTNNRRSSRTHRYPLVLQNQGYLCQTHHHRQRRAVVPVVLSIEKVTVVAGTRVHEELTKERCVFSSFSVLKSFCSHSRRCSCLRPRDTCGRKSCELLSSSHVFLHFS